MGKGFGVNKHTISHFIVIVSKDWVNVYEAYDWENGQLPACSDYRIHLSRERWDAVANGITEDFNNQLKKSGNKPGRFTTGNNAVEIVLGREMMTLLWAIEHCDMDEIPAAVVNWKGLQPEERRWLYIMAKKESNDYNRGWRAALKYALCDNPIRRNV